MLTKTQSNKDYDSGRWSSLRASREVGQYAVMAGLARYCNAENLLEIGCGAANLLEYIPAFSTYHGIDISSSAVSRAKEQHQSSKATFEEADFWSWKPSRKFDAIFFSGSLYYLGGNEKAVNHAADWLTDNGVVIVSLYREYLGLPKWKQVEVFTLSNMDTFWTVSAFRKG